MLGCPRSIQKLTEIDRERFNDTDPCTRHRHRRNRFDVGIMSLGGEENELCKPRVLPFGKQIIQQPMERFFAQSRGSGTGLRTRLVHPKRNRGRQQNAELPRQIGGESLGDPSAGAKREVRSVLIACPDGNEKSIVAFATLFDFRWGKVGKKIRAQSCGHGE